MEVHPATIPDGSSNYGSDFDTDDEALVTELLHKAEKGHASTALLEAPSGSATLVIKDIGDDERPQGVRVPRRLLGYAHDARELAGQIGLQRMSTAQSNGPVAMAVNGGGGGGSGAENVGSRQVDDSASAKKEAASNTVKVTLPNPAAQQDAPRTRESTPFVEPMAEYRSPSQSGQPLSPPAPDLRTPLQRFRTKPKKALSVTDLVSPSWCELQYWYTLTKHGRKRRTPAMRQGSAVHKVLEDQVHQTVRVETRSREDTWGLRIWNVIQGVKTLRETGLTRELEVWGILEGEVVNGVIDELSFQCPDEEMEEKASKEALGQGEEGRKKKGKRKSDELDVPADQPSIKNFLTGSQSAVPNGAESAKVIPPRPRPPPPRVYLIDVKTRTSRSLPSAAAFRPTAMQLMLYHRLLSSLAANNVDASVIFARYNLDPSTSFSDSFIAQVGALNDTFFDAPSSPPSQKEEEEEEEEVEHNAENNATSTRQNGYPPSSQDSLTTLLSNNSLSLLWNLMTSELGTLLPQASSSLGHVLRAEYRDSSDGSVVLGSKTFPMDEKALDTYLHEELRWWRGERGAKGVEVEEAYKCRSCEFAEDCTWRKEKVDDAVKRHREKRGRSAV
ncbi:hypothetical protein MMC25_003945 [Agyrium rufum]|nr:hypothetical protein [Agyrium rufum]